MADQDDLLKAIQSVNDCFSVSALEPRRQGNHGGKSGVAAMFHLTGHRPGAGCPIHASINRCEPDPTLIP
jgi:hypothetical protein